MASRKRIKWALNRGLERVLEPDVHALVMGATFMRGRWHADVFGNDRPIVLELGCGYGRHTVELARRRPDRNVVGVDIKGHRFHVGALAAHEEGLSNVAFLRARAAFLDRCFAEDELDEIWLTFSDPFPKDERGTRRMTSALHHGLYHALVRPGGHVHVKTDSAELYATTLAELREGGWDIEEASEDVHGDLVHRCDPELAGVLGIVTEYEARWLAEGRRIRYLRTRLPDPREPERIERALAGLQGPRRLPSPAGPSNL